MQKAFDCIDRDLLFYKLLKYNINGNIFKCIKAMYSHPISCVKVNNNITDWFNISRGVETGGLFVPNNILTVYK